ncbi:hypothetical protein [Sphingomonas sp.]|jgi:hypothetical protein|uniref:hypothetical protein n=1 Tax=Sphingomonas sp. TaxID=28214 RepID=UPI002E32018B|nr:hypothetical protein [Sphingomonas sp.]HEX4694676.1 hypothetical protein [Sphingomonas sp.]
MPIDGTLSDVSILVIDERPFRGGYVAEVLKAAGALIAGPFDNPAAAVAWSSDTDTLPMLAYIGFTAAPDQSLIDRLDSLGLSCLAVCSESLGEREGIAPRMSLRPPLAAFQIVDALSHLHDACRDRGRAWMDMAANG